MSLFIAGGLDYLTFKRAFQPKLFYDLMILFYDAGERGSAPSCRSLCPRLPSGLQRDGRLLSPTLVTVDGEAHPAELAWHLWVCAASRESKGV